MKTLTGKVVSTKMKNAAVVEVVRFVAHSMYHKRMRKTKRYHAQAEAGIVIGETVKITECKPVSKTITWRISGIVKKNVTT